MIIVIKKTGVFLWDLNQYFALFLYKEIETQNNRNPVVVK